MLGDGQVDKHVWNEETGSFLSEKHRQIAEIINDYDEHLFLCFVPPKLRAINEEHPYAVIYMKDGVQQVVFHLKESEVDETLLARLWASDNAKNDVVGEIEALEQAQYALKLKREQEEREEAQEIGLAILKSPLHSYKHNGKRYD